MSVGCVGPLWSSSRSVSTFREVEISGNGSRENVSAGVSEAGAIVRTHVKLGDLNTTISVLDDHSIQVLACPSASRVNGVTRTGLDSTKNGNTASSWMEVDVI